GIAAALPALARSVPALFGLLILVGVGTGTLDVAINASAARVEAAFRVRVMDGLHAAFSLGVLVGGAGSGLLRRAGAHPSWILAGIAVVIVLTAATNLGSAGPALRSERRVRLGRG